ncbi:MAG: hypothetical protein CL862_05235 [Cyanobium sp. NAT70]|nr:hypothetical protein [Cyanobium sp. NAT70]|tara:strand:+ start:2466 stop:2852 length:387 start_codon:yes stop_codon:yes gene_type:complete
MQKQERSLLIAVVEDNPRIRQLLEEEILDEGHRMLSFPTAEEFLATFDQQAIDLVLLDLMLPGMDGLSCLQQLTERQSTNCKPRVVIVTALNDDEKRQQALAAGAEDYVLKPDLFLRLPEILNSSAQD